MVTSLKQSDFEQNMMQIDTELKRIFAPISAAKCYILHCELESSNCTLCRLVNKLESSQTYALMYIYNVCAPNVA